jgi:hypothetical protein
MTNHGEIGEPRLLRKNIQPAPRQCEKTGSGAFRSGGGFGHSYLVIKGKAAEHRRHLWGWCQIQLHV